MSKSRYAGRAVLAPDKFKGSLTAAEVAEALATGMLDVLPQLETIKLPVADGGDGTVAAALSAGFDKIIVDAVGPTGEPVRAPYALDGDRAVVELAAVVGLSMLPGGRFDPLGSSTYGLGLVIADAIRRGATTIVLGLGGSASTDGGAGLAQALGRGARRWGHDLPPGGASQPPGPLDLARLHTSHTTIIVASDVDNPLLGPRRPACSPQGAAEVEALERAAHWSTLSERPDARR